MLRYAKIPIYYGVELFNLTINYLPIALIFHLGFSIWTYTCPTMFPSVFFSFIR